MNNKIAIGARVLLGLIFFVFGLNGFLNFIPQPPLPEGAVAYMTGLGSTGYFFPVLKGVEVLAGAALITGIFAPLALIVLAPIIVQIFLFHAILTPGVSNLVMPLALVVLALITAYSYRKKYEPLLQAK